MRSDISHLKAVELAIEQPDTNKTESPQERASSRAAHEVWKEIVWLESEYDRLANVVASQKASLAAAQSENAVLRRERQILAERLTTVQGELNTARDSLFAIDRQVQRGIAEARKVPLYEPDNANVTHLAVGRPALTGRPRINE